MSRSRDPIWPGTCTPSGAACGFLPDESVPKTAEAGTGIRSTRRSEKVFLEGVWERNRPPWLRSFTASSYSRTR